MRLRVAKLSFGSVRAVELRSTLQVFLMNSCHRILGVWRLLLSFTGFLVGLLKESVDPYPNIGLRYVFCLP